MKVKDYPAVPGLSLDTLPNICIKTWDNYPVRAQRRIVCAANKFKTLNGSYLVIPASRHYSPIMREIAATLIESGVIAGAGAEQGFIDQFDDFFTREEAMVIAKYSQQPFHPERNGHNRKLFSEGLY